MHGPLAHSMLKNLKLSYTIFFLPHQYVEYKMHVLHTFEMDTLLWLYSIAQLYIK